MIFWWIMAVSVLVLLRTVSMIHHVNGYGRHTTSSIRIARSGIVFELSAEMEYLALTTDSPKLFLVTHHLLCLIVNLSSAFGAIFVIYAVMRDYFPNLGHGKGCIVLLVYAVSSLTYYVLGSLNLADREVAFEASVISFSKYFFLCLMVIVFIQAYGTHPKAGRFISYLHHISTSSYRSLGFLWQEIRYCPKRHGYSGPVQHR